jgi:uncharacterized protein (DUF58 family)
METADLLRKVRKIEIRTKGLSQQVFQGEYHSAFKGRGMSFSEVRQYNYGDDVRSIDWNVTARYNETFIKVFEEERELTVMLLVDMSGSSFFGTQSQLKSELIAEMAAVIAFSAINNNDKVGLILFTDKIEKFILPNKGKHHILYIIREILAFKTQHQTTNIGIALQSLVNMVKKRATTFLFSDFLDENNYQDALNLASKKHDLIGIKVNDKRESTLPDVGLVKLYDAETHEEIWINTSNKHINTQMQQWYSAHETKFLTNFASAGADTIQIKTGGDYVKELHKFFKKRGSK